MKEIAGGCWVAGLLSAALGLYIASAILIVIGILEAGSCWYQEQLNKKQAVSWCKNYPSYKY